MLLESLSDDKPIKFYEHSEGPDGVFTVLHGPLVEIASTADGWPEQLEFARGVRRGERYPITGACELLHADMQNLAGWVLKKVSRRAKLDLVPDGMSKGDHAARFRAGKGSDNLISPVIAQRCNGADLLFFSMWVKSLEDNGLPHVVLETRRDHVPALPLQVRADGWVLIGE